MTLNKHSTIKYFQKGTKPKVIFLAGTHGDEHEVIDVAAEVISEHQHLLPDFIFIPEVSPSAVNSKTRKNKWGRDVNRQFRHNTVDPEARATMELLRNNEVEFCISFHEDIDRKEKFYFYDSKKMSSNKLTTFRSKMRKHGIKLFSGVDDPNLNYVIDEGYWHIKGIPDTEIGAMLDWSVANGISKRTMEIEIPGKADIKLKKKIVNSFFENMVLPLTQ